MTDVVFAALSDSIPDRVSAQNQGTMNNITIGGGCGARSEKDGDFHRKGLLGAKTTRDPAAGTTVTVRTPRGGGHGDPEM